MQNNTISALEPGTFHPQNRLLELALNGNRIHLINSSIFKGLEHLRVLYLSGNQITRLPDFTFCELEVRLFGGLGEAGKKPEILQPLRTAISGNL
ncbi:hypothetical protein L345_17735 [Ophiophagus hannah]|uniref:Uncharacterized protein n=1 Tax=Ophiophagus hannah TaxID=8665 RepID=V8N2S7_OPHHA|nr:hypothetical protein L345_17735 [Ophiophagus hannah]